MSDRPVNLGRYRLVVFDCDGTLVDSQHNIVAAMIEAWRRHGLADPTPEQIRRQVGLTLEIAIERMLGGGDRGGDSVFIAALAETYREIVHDLRARADLDEPMFDGMRELILALEARRSSSASPPARTGLAWSTPFTRWDCASGSTPCRRPIAAAQSPIRRW
jgi:phosphoglycolate phosphatase